MQIFETASSFDIGEFAQGIPEPVAYPDAATKNRAAITAMLSDPFAAVDNYNLMVSESLYGETSTQKLLNTQVQEAAKKSAFQTAVGILSDVNVPLEAKKKALEGLNDFKLDSSILLQTNALQGPSKGESYDHEKARVNMAEFIYDLHKERTERQGIENSVGLTLDNSSTAKSLFEMIDLYIVPFGGNMSMGGLYKQMEQNQGRKPSMFEVLKAAVAQGSTKEQWLDKIRKLPPDKAIEFRRLLAETIKQNRRVVFSSDSDFEKYDLASTLLAEDGYSTPEKYLDNISGLLDVFGLGLLGKDLGKLGKALRAGKNIPKEVESVVASEAKKIATEFEKKRITKQEAAAEIARGSQRVGKEDLKKTSKSVLDVLEGKNEIPAPPTLAQDILSILNGDAKRSDILKRKLDEIDVQIAEQRKAEKALIDKANEERQARYMVLNTINESSLSDAEKASARRIAQQKVNTGVETFVTMKDVLDRKGLNAIVGASNPASAAKIIQQVNPETARALHEVMATDESGKAAEALYGTSRAEAIANDVLPQIGTQTKIRAAKVPNIAERVYERVRELATKAPGTQFTERERQAAKASIVNDFRVANGLTLNEAESTFQLDGNKIRISASYGNANGSWSSAEDAVAHATSSLRQYGVQPHEITILKREGGDRVPVSLAEVKGKEGDYTISIDYEHVIEAGDVGKLDTGFDVKFNTFDRNPWFVWNRQGSVSRYFLDASSMLHPIFTSAATVATDASAKFTRVLLEVADNFARGMQKLSNKRKAKLEEYFREANQNGVAFDITDLKARGFTDDEIDVVRDWRTYWDHHYYLENLDIVRTLNQQRFMKFDNANFSGYAKSVPKNQNLGELYDPVTDTIVTHSKADGDALYASGGTYAQLRRPVNLHGKEIEHIIVPNTPTAYLRKVRDTDSVLSYRDGYFQVQYKAPRFVDVSIKAPNGNHMYWKSIAVAGDTKEAERWMKQYAKANSIPEVDFKIRGDDRAMMKDNDSWWDVNSVNGRIAQRHRGVQLEDGQGLNHIGDGSYIVNPIDSAIRAARSIAGRTVTRDVLETMKARFIKMYGHLLDSNKGITKFPYNKSEIGIKGGAFTKEVADARTTFEYINYLENGYINLADQSFKGMFNALGEILGARGAPAFLERGAYGISDINPSSIGRKGVFYAYIALNPLRQWIVQAHQSIRMFAYNPGAFLKGRMARETGNLSLYLINPSMANAAEAKQFMKFITDSGMMDAVDMHNLVRGSLADSVEKNGVIRMAEKAIEVPRKIGFDFGERANLWMHLAAVYDKYKMAGKNMSDEIVKAEAYSEARALSYDMNFAGDMPYNQTWPSLLLQFMQVPHKALLQLSNRRLDVPTRLKLASLDMLLWGTPFATVFNMMGKDVLPEDETEREFILWGLESIVINKFLSQITGTKTNVDFSSLAPYQSIEGWRDMVEGFYEKGFMGLISHSPAGAFYPKVWDVMRKTTQFFGVTDSPVDDPVNLQQLGSSILSLSSGWSNWVKASVALEMQKKISKKGEVIDPDVTQSEAIMQIFGFGTEHERDYWTSLRKEFRETKAFRDDVNKVYDDVKATLLSKAGPDAIVADYEFVTQMSRFLMKAFDSNPQAQAIIVERIRKDLQNPNDKLALILLRNAGVPDPQAINDRILRAPLSDEQKQILLESVKNAQEARGLED